MSEGQGISAECAVAVDRLEEAGLTRTAAVLREMAAQIKVLEIPPGSVCVFELPEGHTIDDEQRACLTWVWGLSVPGTRCVVLENGLSLRAVLSQLPGP